MNFSEHSLNTRTAVYGKNVKDLIVMNWSQLLTPSPFLLLNKHYNATYYIEKSSVMQFQTFSKTTWRKFMLIQTQWWWLSSSSVRHSPCSMNDGNFFIQFLLLGLQIKITINMWAITAEVSHRRHIYKY